MVETQSTREVAAMQMAVAIARRWRLSEEETTDCISVAWEYCQRYGHLSYSSCAWYACKAVRSGRHFQQSGRSIEYTRRPEIPRPKRTEFALEQIFRTGDDPAEIGGFMIDFREWLKSLDRLQRRIALALAAGATTKETAKRFQRSPGRISQIRVELERSWQEFLTD